MAAGQGFKTFTTGEVLTAGDVNGYLMQGINVFTNATARDAAITAPAEGQFAFTKDNNSLWYYDGAAWVASGATGDIEGVTAGVGISGGGTSGTVTVTNSMATAIDAKGDLVPGTGADTFARLAVGANNTVLTADSAEATGLKWAAADPLTTKGDLFTFSTTEARLAVGSNDTVLTADSSTATGLKWAAPAGGGSLTLLSTTNIAAAASTTVTGIDQTYTNLIVLVEGVSQTNSGDGIRIAPNSVQTGYSGVIASSVSAPSTTTTTDISIYNGFGITSSNTNNVFLCEISNYASTTQFKPMTMVSSAIASSNPQGSWAAGAWRSTSAITSIQLWTYYSFNAAGTIKIYGVK